MAVGYNDGAMCVGFVKLKIWLSWCVLEKACCMMIIDHVRTLFAVCKSLYLSSTQLERRFASFFSLSLIFWCSPIIMYDSRLSRAAFQPICIVLKMLNFKSAKDKKWSELKALLQAIKTFKREQNWCNRWNGKQFHDLFLSFSLLSISFLKLHSEIKEFSFSPKKNW